MSAHNVSRETKNVVIFDVFDFFVCKLTLKRAKYKGIGWILILFLRFMR